ncbi:Uncharacterized protein BM_BM49 [Brugia malayi]|uniref:Bm49 n=1 Tax=Brugia malayi TaxID=6279 RepID=A0A0K0JGM8_BRUMA|nr:Uncharacterized protein BM_BM49 [Brugia malayi]CRZ21847.1 Bm49 [Brugia malayi]VIO87872.1 Uncharacterized protein BM_BM49 [Brugia malayi]
MSYFLLIFLIFFQLQKNYAEGEMTSMPPPIDTGDGVTGISILTTTKGTPCLVPLTALPGWFIVTSILHEIIRSF